ncbi:MAG: adenylyltransferase/cytidyltransferase family protein [Candidatus Saccharimonadales bacterium]
MEQQETRSIVEDSSVFIEAHNSFIQSDFGQKLSESIRFARFKPEHISDEDWVDTLGVDIDSLKHMPLIYGMTRAFLNECRNTDTNRAVSFSEEQEKVLLFAAITNNWGEVETGNTAYDQKTVDVESREKDAYRKVAEEIIGRDIDIKTRMLIERTVFDRYSELGQAFDAIQKVSYLRIGLIAYKKAYEAEDAVLSNHLKWLCANVLSNQIIMLMEYSKKYPPIRKFLESQQDIISDAFESIDTAIFAEHGQNESLRTELYWQNKKTWYEFRQFEAEDLRGKIINTALAFIVEETPKEEARKKIENLLSTYTRLISNGNDIRSEGSRRSNESLFGNYSNFETRFIPDRSQLQKKVEAIRELGLQIVLTSGSFDLLHIGHAGYLEKAKEQGSVLIVGVDSDDKMKHKGPDRPYIPEVERTKLLSYLRSVDIITIKPADEEKWGLIKAIRPDILITTQETYTDKETAELYEYCKRVISLPPQATTSTSAKIRRMQIGFGEKFFDQTKISIDKLIAENQDVPVHELREKVYAAIEEILEDTING